LRNAEDNKELHHRRHQGQALVMSNINLAIRNENENDYRIVEEMVREVFWNLYVPGCSEHFILHNLRNSSDFIPELDFVAEKEGQIVGQIVYSRGRLKYTQGAEKEVVSFGPVSVLPTFQKQGIGSGLITHTINLARRMGFPAICIYGDPRYYSRLGFRCAEKYEIKTADDKFAVALQVLELQRGVLNNKPGKFIESAAFEVDENEFTKYDTAFPFKEKAETDSQREFRLLASLRY
jgi:predicted N-acetyltransferase YhbS